MAPSKAKGKARAAGSSSAALSASRGSRGSARKPKDRSADIYADMLAESAAGESEESLTDRPLKKRKIASRGTSGPQLSPQDRSRAVQTVEDSLESDDDDSDISFENVDIEQPLMTKRDDSVDGGIDDVSVAVETATLPKHPQIKRKKASPAEKSFRLLVHKAHVLCLLGHCIYINSWCNAREVHEHLRHLLSTKTKSYLVPDTSLSQFQRNRSFLDGLQQASDTFRGGFILSGSGLCKTHWPVDYEHGHDPAESDSMARADFTAAAARLKGSQDTANQLFCALLRSVGVQARLVCSLQPLPFANPPAKAVETPKAAKSVIYAMTTPSRPSASDPDTDDQGVQASSTIGKVPSARRRLGQPAFHAESIPSPQPSKKKRTRKLSYPVFWVEAFDHAHQKWITVDCMVTQTINKPSKLEPPSSYSLNQMSYVIAFEPDGVARDVTLRYTRAFNAKTRRHRVESSDGGAQWLKKALRIVRRRGGVLDRDQVEDAELAQRAAREGLPSNVLDFKDHPYYALERHLKRHEIFHPRREVGKVNAGTAAKPRMEPVFRRQDVQVCHSADRWYRMGREIKAGQQPLKHAPSRRPGARLRPADDGDEDENSAMVALYGPEQTQLYVPQPVVGDRVPKNAYGNLDVYVPSMIPAGGSHIRHELAKHAAKVLKVDCADAVTGFSFKGRRGTAVVDGIVVASQFAEAIYATIDSLQHDQAESASMGRSAMALKMWKRFLTGLRIVERVNAHFTDAEKTDIREEINAEEDELADTADAGGFLPGDADGGDAMPTAGKFSLEELGRLSRNGKKRQRKPPSEDSDRNAAVSPSEEHKSQDSTPIPVHTPQPKRRRRVLDEDASDEDYREDDFDKAVDHRTNPESIESYAMAGLEGGGFSIDDDDQDMAGGFLPDDGNEDDTAGGFAPDDDDGNNVAGGFVSADVEEVSVADGFVEDDSPVPQERSAGFSNHDSPEKGHPGSTKAHIEELRYPATAPEGDSVVDTAASGPLPDADDERSPVAPRTDLPLEADGESVAQHSHELHTRPEGDDAREGASDQSSMLSHDPEDDDAEPDWLESE